MARAEFPVWTVSENGAAMTEAEIPQPSVQLRPLPEVPSIGYTGPIVY